MEKLVAALLGNYKTTILGFVTGLGLIITELIALLDGIETTVFNGELFLAGLGMITLGIFAKDGDKTSEDVTRITSRIMGK